MSNFGTNHEQSASRHAGCPPRLTPEARSARAVGTLSSRAVRPRLSVRGCTSARRARARSAARDTHRRALRHGRGGGLRRRARLARLPCRTQPGLDPPSPWRSGKRLSLSAGTRRARDRAGHSHRRAAARCCGNAPCGNRVRALPRARGRHHRASQRPEGARPLCHATPVPGRDPNGRHGLSPAHRCRVASERCLDAMAGRVRAVPPARSERSRSSRLRHRAVATPRRHPGGMLAPGVGS